MFLDALHLRWQYEPEGFVLPDGRWYLPDFHVDGIGWLEIKPTIAAATQDDKWLQFSSHRAEPSFLLIGPIPEPGYDVCGGTFDIHVPCDGYYAWCVCPTCLKVGITFNGRGARVCKHDPTDDKSYTHDHPLITQAYGKARQARFEHGAMVPAANLWTEFWHDGTILDRGITGGAQWFREPVLGPFPLSVSRLT